MPLEWNADELATLHSMWRAGLTGAAIAAKLGTSRSAVLGKIARIGLKRSRRPVRRKPPPATKPKFPFIARVKRKPPQKPAGPVHFAQLAEHHCRWIPGEPHTQMYCGATKITGSSYCATHTRIAWARTAAKAVAA